MTIFVEWDFEAATEKQAANNKQTKMPPKKRNSRAAQLQPQMAAVSDYDTDAANYTDTQQHIPMPDPTPARTNGELNMLVLKRWYPDLEAIIAIAPFAVLYSCNPATQQWEKCDTQGSLFVCQLSAEPGTSFPRYRVIILNRRHMENFVLDLVSPENIEVTEEFIICTVMNEELDPAQPQIYGIWMYSDGESGVDTREMIAATIVDCASRAEQEMSAQDENGQSFRQQEQYGGYGLDGSSYDQVQSELQGYQEPAHSFQPTSVAGQQIDLATLFAKPPQQGNTPAQLMPGADADFFYSGQYPAPAPPQQHSQNALLELFKNANKV